MGITRKKKKKTQPIRDRGSRVYAEERQICACMQSYKETCGSGAEGGRAGLFGDGGFDVVGEPGQTLKYPFPGRRTTRLDFPCVVFGDLLELELVG